MNFVLRLVFNGSYPNTKEQSRLAILNDDNQQQLATIKRL